MAKQDRKAFFARLRRYFIAGILTVIPLWITWLVFKFLVVQLSRFGAPWVRAMSRAIDQYAPAVAHWLLEPWFQNALAVILTLVGLTLLGAAATHVIGRRIINLFDHLMTRIPLVQTIYGSTKKLLVALQQKPERVERVVLINFPSKEMKTVGFVTRVMKDERTGEELAAVYVPTTPNPTSGYLEIVPISQLVTTDWTLDEAMSFIISGGAVAPERIKYSSDTDSSANP